MSMEYLTKEEFVLVLKEIERIMDAEVEKPDDEMDTELVDMCASILAKAYNPGYKDEKPSEMYCPWKETTHERKKDATEMYAEFISMLAMSDEDDEEFTEENLIKTIKKEKKKLWFLRDYSYIHECYLTLSEVHGYSYNNEYEEKAERLIARRKRIRKLKEQFSDFFKI